MVNTTPVQHSLLTVGTMAVNSIRRSKPSGKLNIHFSCQFAENLSVFNTTCLGTGKIIPLSKKAAAAAAKAAVTATLTATTDSENKEDSSNSGQVSEFLMLN